VPTPRRWNSTLARASSCAFSQTQQHIFPVIAEISEFWLLDIRRLTYHAFSSSFFAHFIDVLGVRDFLAPVCMLLIERSSNKVIRQPTEDVQSSLSLPIAIFQQAPAEVQRYVRG